MLAAEDPSLVSVSTDSLAGFGSPAVSLLLMDAVLVDRELYLLKSQLCLGKSCIKRSSDKESDGLGLALATGRGLRFGGDIFGSSSESTAESGIIKRVKSCTGT